MDFVVICSKEDFDDKFIDKNGYVDFFLNITLRIDRYSKIMNFIIIFYIYIGFLFCRV